MNPWLFPAATHSAANRAPTAMPLVEPRSAARTHPSAHIAVFTTSTDQSGLTRSPYARGHFSVHFMRLYVPGVEKWMKKMFSKSFIEQK